MRKPASPIDRAFRCASDGRAKRGRAERDDEKADEKDNERDDA